MEHKLQTYSLSLNRIDVLEWVWGARCKLCSALGDDSVPALKAELLLCGGCCFFLLIIVMDTDMFNTLPVWQEAQNRIFSSAVLYFIKLEQKLLWCLPRASFPPCRNLFAGGRSALAEVPHLSSRLSRNSHCRGNTPGKSL